MSGIFILLPKHLLRASGAQNDSNIDTTTGPTLDLTGSNHRDTPTNTATATGTARDSAAEHVIISICLRKVRAELFSFSFELGKMYEQGVKEAAQLQIESERRDMSAIHIEARADRLPMTKRRTRRQWYHRHRSDPRRTRSNRTQSSRRAYTHGNSDRELLMSRKCHHIEVRRVSKILQHTTPHHLPHHPL